VGRLANTVVNTRITLYIVAYLILFPSNNRAHKSKGNWEDRNILYHRRHGAITGNCSYCIGYVIEHCVVITFCVGLYGKI
jgi:hypothetical protein